MVLFLGQVFLVYYWLCVQRPLLVRLVEIYLAPGIKQRLVTVLIHCIISPAVSYVALRIESNFSGKGLTSTGLCLQISSALILCDISLENVLVPIVIQF